MDVVAIVGPTGSGKTFIAHNLARKLKNVGIETEIISCDSVQVYKHFDIGTDKVSKELQNEFKYHLIDILEPNEGRFSAGEFRKMFDNIVSNLIKANKLAILVGGTGLYYKAIKIGIFEGPTANNEIRDKLYKTSQKLGISYLYDMLAKIDPEYAHKIGKNDLKRIVRALEVYEITGKKFSELHKTSTNPSPFKILSFFIIPERNKLYNTIEKRVDTMINKGLIDEVKFITNQYGFDIYPLTSIGYKEVVMYLKGEINLEKTIDLIKKNTKNFARRQIILFRKLEFEKSISPDKTLDDTTNEIYEDILRNIK
ncbi:MAG: tRNA (adenosine(37)-N6)-dimethylallyltransferase MiaA [Brevinematales bacterium]|nr:tRNA (adenosine(37)-N6)-dimethylallyltransferase MiaA [Brevinematales bacterium]